MLFMHTPTMPKLTRNADPESEITPASADRLVAVLSDTHGLLRASVLPHLKGVTHILHAGDVGDPAILEELARYAPVTAIRGNVDVSGACAALPATEMLTLGAITVYLVHSLADLDIEPTAAGVQLVVSGHSHKPALEERRGVTYLNPGSVGPRRFKLPISMAMVTIQETHIETEFITLDA